MLEMTVQSVVSSKLRICLEIKSELSSSDMEWLRHNFRGFERHANGTQYRFLYSGGKRSTWLTDGEVLTRGIIEPVEREELA